MWLVFYFPMETSYKPYQTAMKKITILLLCILSIIYSCSEKQNKEVKHTFVAVKEVPEIELETVTDSTQKNYDFINTTTNQKVSVLHHIEQTAFHVYNSVTFTTDKIGVLVGGTGLRARITKNGGKTWKQYSFSRFANSFHDIAFVNKSLFVVGESNYIFKTSDLGQSWSVLDTEHFFDVKGIVQFEYYKIRFLNHKLGYISGVQNGHPVLLKTTNGGTDWGVVQKKGLDSKEFAISDFKILSENELIIVTQSGNCYKSIDQGNTWTLIYSSDEQYSQLNAIDFKDAQTGYIGGLNGTLLHTDDGGTTWEKIALPAAASKSNISDILFVQDHFLITSAISFDNEERDVFVYTIDEKGSNLQPFLTKDDSEVFFVGDSYGLDVLQDTVYVLDRNNLYKTVVADKE